jgi:hypothetical protein
MAFVTGMLQTLVREEPGGTGDHPASCSLCAGVFPPRVQRPELEANHTPTSSEEVKNQWSYSSTPPPPTHTCLHGLCLRLLEGVYAGTWWRDGSTPPILL